jgi:chromosome partitioning protein
MVAINLAAAAVELGLKPVVIDRDEQGTSMLYHQAGNLPFEVLPDYPQSAPDVDLVLVDHMANDRVIPRPPLLVMPVIPKRSQYAAYAEALKQAEDAGKRIITVVTNGDLRREQERAAVLALKQRGAFEIRASGIFSRADNDYRTIYDPALNGAYGVRDRRHEFSVILAAVLQNQQGKDLNHAEA